MKKLAIILVLISLFLNSCSSVPAYKKEFKKGVEMHKQKKYDEALKFFKKALEMNKYYEKAAFNIATIYYQRNDMENAVKYLEKTLDINSSNEKARYTLSTIYFNKGNYQKVYDNLLRTKGENATDLFRKLVATLINKGYAFKGNISLAKDHKIDKFDSGKSKWTEWYETLIDFKLYYKSSGETSMKSFSYFSSTSEEISDHAKKIVKNLKLSKNEAANPEEFTFRIQGELIIDPIETKLKLYETTFKQIMDSNLLVITRPDTNSCWMSDSIRTSFSGMVVTELTINPDGTVKDWKVADIYKSNEKIAECIGEKLADVKFNNFPDSGERKLIVHSTRTFFYRF